MNEPKRVPNPKSRQNNNPWDSNENPLWLLTIEELHQLPYGYQLTSINGDTAIVGIDKIDEDTRFGFIAWGIKESDLEYKQS